MCHEDQTHHPTDDQVATAARPGGIAPGPRSPARLLVPDQPPRLHPGAALRHPGAQDVPQDRLPRRRRGPGGLPRAARRPGAGQGAPLLDPVLRGAAAPPKRGFRKLQRKAFRRARLRGLIGDRPELALDATGLYARRNTARRFPMRHFTLLAVACHTPSHLLAAAEVAVGPTNESPFFDDLVGEAGQHAVWDRLLADAAYDSEAHHATARFFGLRSAVIPLNRRGTGRRWPRTRYRRQMVRRFRRKPKGSRYRRVYGQRWQAESVFSRNKRLLGAALRGRSDESRERECLLRVLTHNLMLLAAAEN